MSIYNQSRTESSFWNVTDENENTKTIKHKASKVYVIVPNILVVDPNETLNSTTNSVFEKYNITSSMKKESLLIKIQYNNTSLCITLKKNTTSIVFTDGRKTSSNDDVENITIPLVEFFEEIRRYQNALSDELSIQSITELCNNIAKKKIHKPQPSRKQNTTHILNDIKSNTDKSNITTLESINLSGIEPNSPQKPNSKKNKNLNNEDLNGILEAISEEDSNESNETTPEEHQITNQDVKHENTEKSEIFEKTNYSIETNDSETPHGFGEKIKKQLHIIIILITSGAVAVGILQTPEEEIVNDINETSNTINTTIDQILKSDVMSSVVVI
jgi:hypothetical protein